MAEWNAYYRDEDEDEEQEEGEQSGGDMNAPQGHDFFLLDLQRYFLFFNHISPVKELEMYMTSLIRSHFNAVQFCVVNFN